MSLNIHSISHGSADYDAAVALRRRVLRSPLGLDFTMQQLADEVSDAHMAEFENETLIATLILSHYDGCRLKLRQMAVDETMHGRGVGSQLLAAAEAHALASGFNGIVLNARVSAKGFYERNGYAATGAIFTEVTVPHTRMEKKLQRRNTAGET